jgi:hypothetical protein
MEIFFSQNFSKLRVEKEIQNEVLCKLILKNFFKIYVRELISSASLNTYELD